jgi:hypothetical protein
MKLNLLPATVSKGRQAKTALVVSGLVFVVSIGASIGMTLASAKSLAEAQQQVADARPAAERAVLTANQADQIMQMQEVTWLNKNVALAQAMIAHNDKYPALYDSLRPWIPPFFRVTRMQASPSGEQTVVNLSGTLDNYQQYADLMLALMRHPKAVTVARGGFQTVDPYVPNLTSVDQQGRARRPGEAPIPDDELERLQFFAQQGAGQPTGYLGVGNFGSGTFNTRGAMPGSSLVSVTLVLTENTQVPNPRATLGSGAGAGAGTGGFPGAPGMGAPPAGPGMTIGDVGAAADR